MATRYAEPTDLAFRFDIRTIGQLCTDDGQELSREAVMEHENVRMALNDASGRVEAALRHGNRYTPDNIADLTENSLNHLKSIVCTIAMTRLLRRRPGTYTDLLQQLAAEAEDHLKQISSGYDVFSLDGHVVHGGTISDEGNTNSEQVSLLNIRNLVSDNMIGRAFPHRGSTGNRDRGFNNR